MKPHPRTSRPRISRQSLHRFAIGGAWFFIVVSVLHLAWVVFTLVPDFGTTKLYHIETATGSYSAWLLSYSGFVGLLWAFIQAIVLVAAVAATFLKNNKYRRLGHAALIGWASLWFVNLLWLTSVDARFDSYGQTFVMSILTACTIYRAVRGWNAPPSLPALKLPSRLAAESTSPISNDRPDNDNNQTESLPTIDAGAPHNEYGIASDDAPLAYQPAQYTDDPLAPADDFRLGAADDPVEKSLRASGSALKRAYDFTIGACDRAGHLAGTAAKRCAGACGAGWRASRQYLRNHGVLPQTTAPQHNNSA